MYKYLGHCHQQNPFDGTHTNCSHLSNSFEILFLFMRHNYLLTATFLCYGLNEENNGG